jgi:preprotein translocase subunit SecA
LKENKSYNIAIEHRYDLNVFKNQIVYSNNSNFEFVYLNSMFINNPFRPYERKYDVVIVDEVDNMFIVQGASPALLFEGCDIIQYIIIEKKIFKS